MEDFKGKIGDKEEAEIIDRFDLEESLLQFCQENQDHQCRVYLS